MMQVKTLPPWFTKKKNKKIQKKRHEDKKFVYIDISKQYKPKKRSK